MLCLQALIESNDCEEVSQYIQRITNRSYSEPPTFFTGNRIADAILDDKSALAESVGAKLVFDGEIYDRIPAADTDDSSFHTTKADKLNHGFGLSNIRRTVDMYSGMFSADCSDGVFTLEVGLNVGEYVRR